MNLKTFLFLTGLTFAVIFYSCGKDTVNNITNPPSVNDSLIYSKDSLVVYSDSTFLKHIEIDTLQSNKYKINFESLVNDTTKAFIGIIFQYYQDSSHILYSEALQGNNLNQNYNKTINVQASHSFDLGINIGYNVPAPLGEYIRVKNIKIYIVP